MTCAACGGDCEREVWRFPTRPAPHDRPFLRSRWFSDPFLGGTGDEFCSPECSLGFEEHRRTGRAPDFLHALRGGPPTGESQCPS
jgi:hypothetical protein